MNISFCINRLGLAGLGVTLSSLIRNCSSPSQLHLWFLCAGFTEKDKSLLKKHLKKENFDGETTLVDFDPLAHFGSFCSLHGDHTTYGRLLLADIIPDEVVLYLDADLVIERDVLELNGFDFGKKALAAVGGGVFEYTLGNKFYINKLGIAPGTPYFNAGVLLLNLHEWRVQQVKEKCFEFAEQYPMELPSHDQSLLNILLAGNFAWLPDSYNCEWLADKQKPEVADKMILHFVGSPKPWDPFGRLIHNGYPTWNSYSTPEWTKATGGLRMSDIRRAWKIRRSYIRSLLNKIKAA